MILASGVRGRGFNSRSAPSFSFCSVETVQIVEVTIPLSFLLIIRISCAYSVRCCWVWICLSIRPVTTSGCTKRRAIQLCFSCVIEGIHDVTSECLAVIDACEIILESHCPSDVLPYALGRSISHAVNCLIVARLHSATWIHINRWIVLAAPH